MVIQYFIRPGKFNFSFTVFLGGVGGLENH
jgi:hypothetical protein